MNGTLMKRLFHFWQTAAPTDTQIQFHKGTDIWLKRTDTWKPKLIWQTKLSCPHWFVKPRSFSLLTGIDTKPVTYNKLSTSLWKQAFRLQISFCTTCKLA